MNNLILVVEDDDFLYNALKQQLKKDEFRVLRATNGEEGLEASLAEKPDLIIADIMMPVMDGVEMVSKLREDNWGKNVPVMFLTNAGYPGKQEEANKLEAKYIVKASIHLPEIIQEIRKMLEKIKLN